MNNREAIRNDLKTLRDDWWLPIRLTAPGGNVYDKINGTQKQLLGGVRSESKPFDPDVGGRIVIDRVSVTMLLSDLERVPVQGETWFIEYPENLLTSGSYKKTAFTSDNIDVGGETIGYMKVFPQEVKTA